MSNALYDNARARYLIGVSSWMTENIKAILVDTTVYSVNLSAHQTIGDVGTVGSSPCFITGAVALTNKAAVAGAASAANVTFSAVTGNTADAIILFNDTGTVSTSYLIAYIDTGTGLPITPNGGDIIVTWDTGVNKVFKL